MAATTVSLSTADAMLAEQRRQRRRDRLLMMTLVELLSIMVFVAMAYALASRDEAQLSTDWKAKFQDVSQRLAQAERTIVQLQKELADAKDAAKILAEEYTGQPLPIDASKSWEEIQKILRQIAEKKRSGSADQTRRTQVALAGGGAFGLPACATPSFAYTVMLYSDESMQAVPTWTSGESSAARRMSAVVTLADAGRLPRATFSGLAQQANIDAGRDGACILRITAKPAESYLHDVYMRQINELSRWFVVRRVAMDGR